MKQAREPRVPQTIAVYTDYKSPYAYLAKDLAYALEDSRDIVIDWLPYTLAIPDFLGSARVDETGSVVEQDRTPHQWRRVRYSYMDARRYANARGLVIRGTQKIWDTSLAGTALLWAKQSDRDAFRRFHDLIFERFWQRQLDIEDVAVLESVLDEAGVPTNGFEAYVTGEGRMEHDDVRAAAEEAGVFGVPMFVLDGELFWGREHLDLICTRLDATGIHAR